MRYAIYFTPSRDHILTALAEEWLGRSAFTGALTPPASSGALSAVEVAFHTASARRYGFHATLKAPFRLAANESEAALDAALSRFVATQSPFSIPKLVLGDLDGFFALVPSEPCAALNTLAGEVVSHFEPFRAPLTEVEIERRNPDGLSQLECRNLMQWGYPYVFEAFRFHMTLSGRADTAIKPKLRAALESHFNMVLNKPLEIAGLALFVEPEPGAPFHIQSYYALGQQEKRKFA
ncbi:DUF1045 domain-containing protein [Limoniibacter endophyticus]|uniref:Phosphonate metabolism protein n=1 Tax=Limoniibacter endophyticus TaxID=1565040 RepID=A0A8J3DHE3_9HYPH|nr:DUF1045 domain-containing protein [Limoniibacter endophyticus]GHC66885.1 phosphonate metabolism protein [Limoniibacter endophyticus]